MYGTAFLLPIGVLAGLVRVNEPIVEVTREAYLPAPGPRAAAYLWVTYLGPGKVIEEVLTEERVSDQFERPRRRRSADNGRTWSEWAPADDLRPYARDDHLWWAPSYPSFLYDRRTNSTLAMWLRQHVVEGRYYNHVFVRRSYPPAPLPSGGGNDEGNPHPWPLSQGERGTANGDGWGEPQMLRYEEGEEFDPADPLKPGFLQRNGAYFGQKIIRTRRGTLVFPVCSVRIPDNAPDPNPQGVSVWDTPADSRNIGSLLFVGGWNAQLGSYDWMAGKPVWLPREVSSRGLMEPDVAELKDGRLLVIWRGSNAGLDPTQQPGRKWFSVSEDGGRTLSPPEELRYDDGSRFYSPSSYHLLIRHSRNRRLYWIGNIAPAPTAGNEPRYPLIIAEVDERIAALRKSTVTAIDDRGPDDPLHLSLSNFCVLEDREAHEFVLYMTRVGDPGGDGVFRYRLRLK